MEASFIAWAKRRAAKLPQIELGIGDDCALLSTVGVAAGKSIVATTDSLCDGTHFRLTEHDAIRIGRKLASVNLSDLASMGATAWTMLVSLCLPRAGYRSVEGGPHEKSSRTTEALACEIFEGICQRAEQFSVSIAGGDTNVWDGPLCVNLTALGLVEPGQAWLRSGAKPGDLIVVSGELGGSLLGKHLDFVPRLELASQLRSIAKINAAIDISDGLALDLSRMADASRCGAVVKTSQVPISEAARSRSQISGSNALEHALSDGEDFELLMAVSPDQFAMIESAKLETKLTVIGEFVSRTGLWASEGGKWVQLAPRGYVHR